MVAFNFQPQFRHKLLAGLKLQTFRATKRCDVGDPVQIYTGQRTRQCEKLLDGVCTHVWPGVIDLECVTFGETCHAEYERLKPGDNAITGLPLDDFAKLDGFDSHQQMLQFFEKRKNHFPFRGWLHKWKPN